MLHVHRCIMYVHFAIVFLSQSCASAAARTGHPHSVGRPGLYVRRHAYGVRDHSAHMHIHARDMRIGGRSRCTWMSRTRGSISDPRGLLELERSCSGSRTGIPGCMHISAVYAWRLMECIEASARAHSHVHVHRSTRALDPVINITGKTQRTRALMINISAVPC